MKFPNWEKQTVITWRPVTERPEEGRYLLIQYLDPGGERACDPVAYENGHFVYSYDRRTWGEINEEVIFGWSYLPFDD